MIKLQNIVSDMDNEYMIDHIKNFCYTRLAATLANVTNVVCNTDGTIVQYPFVSQTDIWIH